MTDIERLADLLRMMRGVTASVSSMSIVFLWDLDTWSVEVDGKVYTGKRLEDVLTRAASFALPDSRLPK